MAFGEIIKAIQWNKKNNDRLYPVRAYVVIHSGVNPDDPDPLGVSPDKSRHDSIVYYTGRVVYADTPTPQLTSGSEHWNSYVTDIHGQLSINFDRSLDIKIYPDGKFSLLQKIKGHPIGGLPAIQLQGVDVADSLLVVTSGREVISVGVARQPDEGIPPH